MQKDTGPKKRPYEPPRVTSRKLAAADIVKQIDAASRPAASGASYAALIDEDDPHGPVGIFNEHGAPLIVMPFAVYEWFYRNVPLKPATKLPRSWSRARRKAWRAKQARRWATRLGKNSPGAT